jgi:ceramide glucosyltransferase
LIPALLNLAAADFSLEAWMEALCAAGAKLLADAGVSRALGVREEAGYLLLGPVRDAVAFGLWLRAFCGRSVEWRGRTLRITRGSRLVPTEPESTPIHRPEPAGSL